MRSDTYDIDTSVFVCLTGNKTHVNVRREFHTSVNFPL